MSRTVTLHRRLSLSGALIRITLEPWGEGEQVKIVKLERKPKSSSRYQRLKDEEGHVYRNPQKKANCFSCWMNFVRRQASRWFCECARMCKWNVVINTGIPPYS